MHIRKTRQQRLLGLLLVVLLPGYCQAQDEEVTLEAYRLRVTRLGQDLRSDPADQDMVRYVWEYEHAISELPFADSARSDVAALVSGRDVLVLGEPHGERTQGKVGVIRAVGAELKTRPRILFHEGLFERWAPCLAELNEGQLSERDLSIRMRELWAELYLELYPGIDRGVAEGSSEPMADDLADVCFAAHASGFEVRAAGKIARFRALLRRTYDDPFPRNATRLQKARDVAFGMLAGRAAHEDARPFVLCVVGAHHAVGAGRFVQRWPGSPPAVLLMTSGRCVLELEARFGRESTTAPSATGGEERSVIRYGTGSVFFLAPRWPPGEEGTARRRRALTSLSGHLKRIPRPTNRDPK